MSLHLTSDIANIIRGRCQTSEWYHGWYTQRSASQHMCTQNKIEIHQASCTAVTERGTVFHSYKQ